MKYNTEFICTYKSFEDDMSDICYHAQLLQAFNLSKYNPEQVISLTDELYDELRENKEIRDILNILSTKPQFVEIFANENTLDNVFIFQLLLSYDYFDLFHRSLIDYYNNSLKKEFYFQELKNFIIAS